MTNIIVSYSLIIFIMAKKESKRVIVHKFDWTPFVFILVQFLLLALAFGIYFVC